MQKLRRWIVSPDSSVVVFMWLVVFDGFGSGIPQVHYLVWVSYLAILLQWLTRVIKNRETFSIPKIVVPLVLILFQQIMSVPTAPLPFHALEVVLRYLILALGCFYLLDNLQHTLEPRKVENVIISMAVVFCLFDILNVLNWFNSWWVINDTVFAASPFGYRLHGVFLRHPNLEAAFLNLVLPLVVLRILRQRQLHRRLPWLLLLGLIVVVEFFTSSRGGWLAAILGLGTMSILLLIPVLVRTKDKGINLLKEVFHSRSRIITAILAIVIIIVAGVIFIWQLNVTYHVPVVSARSDIWRTVWNVFLKNPVLGNGAGSMQILPAVEDQLPPGFYMSHAHNLLLQVAAETGIIGVVLILILAGLVLRAFYHAWRDANRNTRIDLAAYAGILVGVGAHNLVDYIFEAPIYLLCTIIFLFFVYQHTPQSEYLRLRGRLVFPIFALLLVAYTLGSLFTLHGSNEHYIGVKNLEKEDWQLISESMCEAVEKNPYNSFYYFQCGLVQAYAYQESDEDALLDSAFSMFVEGLEIDPYWPVHWANLAALQWEAGRSAEALQNMLRALSMAPRNATFALNLGCMYEESGQRTKAIDAYQHALYNDPWLSQSLFFTKTALRSELVQVLPVEVEKPLRRQFTWEGWLLLNSNQPEQARQAFMQALELKPDYGLAFSGLALANYALGLEEQARIYAETGAIADVDAPIVFLIAGQMVELQGRSIDAATYYYLTYTNTKFHSFSKIYYEGVYRKWALPFDLVPQLEDGVLTGEMLESFFTLVDRLRELGQVDKAQQVSDWIAEYSP